MSSLYLKFFRIDKILFHSLPYLQTFENKVVSEIIKRL